MQRRILRLGKSLKMTGIEVGCLKFRPKLKPPICNQVLQCRILRLGKSLKMTDIEVGRLKFRPKIEDADLQPGAAPNPALREIFMRQPHSCFKESTGLATAVLMV
ncbi:MAG TPA: hypothetical protein VD816_10615 [Ohtaekwangia sp.]|nr:hypothetical protein [Ohtaekwangia sp.]